MFTRFSKSTIKIFLFVVLLTSIIVSSNLLPRLSDAATSNLAIGPLTPQDVVYQIVTDRFFDGDTSNNIPAGFDSTLFDGTGSDLKLFQGGDWQGIISKIPYLKNMGITAVWISPPYANRNTVITDYLPGGGINRWTSFHGYHARNFFMTNNHFGSMLKFEELRSILRSNGIKLIIDFVTNHTSRWQNPTDNFKPEYGKLYEPDKDIWGNYVFDANGEPVDHNQDGKIENLLADPHNDVRGWFHGIGDRGTDTTKFGYRHRDLASLADFSQENSEVVAHLEGAVKFWKAKGIDGIRHDATLHVNPAFMKGLKDAVDSSSGGPISHFGEFFIGRPDPKYAEYKTFPDRTGVHNLDFEFYRSITATFGNFSRPMSDFGNMLIYTSNDYIYENQALPFLDNHDVTRFRFIQPNNRPYHAALATLLTSRGTPVIYYGTEQYLTSADASDIAGRVFMQRVAQFDETTTAFRLIRMLSELRRSNEAVAYGTTQILHSDDNVLVFKRQFFDKKVVVAVNRQPEINVLVPALNTTLPVGSYSDYLGGLLYGQSATVTNVLGQNRIDAFVLAGGEVNVWSHNPSLGTILPRIGDVVSVMGRIGNTVRIYGTGLGGNPQVRFDTTIATVISATDSMIEVTVPNVTPGIRSLTVTNNSSVSNPFRYEVLSGDQVQVIFHVNATTVPGQYIHVVGSIPELGNWNPANSSESMMNPNYPKWFLPISVPAGTSFEFKFIKKDTSGNVIWEGGNNRVFTSPTSSTATIDTPFYYWQ